MYLSIISIYFNFKYFKELFLKTPFLETLLLFGSKPLLFSGKKHFEFNFILSNSKVDLM